MTKRSIPIMIILMIVTLGLYNIYWYLHFQSELKKKTGEGFGAFGHFLMTIFTLGFYSIYWQYAAGRRLALQGASDLSVVYLLLSIFSAGWINPFLMQHQANQL